MFEDIVVAAVVQVYSFHDEEDGKDYHWNATHGRELAVQAGHQIVIADLAQAGLTLEHILAIYPDLDVAHALALPLDALLEPLLFVSHRNKHVLIDGWHRYYKAVAIGLEELPAYILTQEEADSIRA